MIGTAGHIILDVATSVFAFIAAMHLWQVNKKTPSFAKLRRASIALGIVGSLQLVRAITRFLE